jgi:hypothetical protein
MHSISTTKINSKCLPEVGTSELSGGTLGIFAIDFVGSVTAVVFVVALPRAEDAPTVAAPEFRRFAKVRKKRMSLMEEK